MGYIFQASAYNFGYNHLARYWPLHIPSRKNIGVGSLVSTSRHRSLENIELDNPVHPQQRDIYVGPRISHTAEARWQGNLHELQVGMLVATLAGG